jgi:hypothetical protein
MLTETRRRTDTVARWVVGVLLIGHGLIHLLGPVEIWGVADLEELTGRPSIDIVQTAADIGANGWLAAFLILLIAGIGVFTRQSWWRLWAIVGVVVSQAVIVIWWADAATGTIPNLLVIAAVVSSRRLGIDYLEVDRT